MNESWEPLAINGLGLEIVPMDIVPDKRFALHVHQYPTRFVPSFSVTSPPDPNRTITEGVEMMLGASRHKGIHSIVHLAG